MECFVIIVVVKIYILWDENGNHPSYNQVYSAPFNSTAQISCRGLGDLCFTKIFCRGSTGATCINGYCRCNNTEYSYCECLRKLLTYYIHMYYVDN